MKECKHKGAYRFHENAPMLCPDCDKYVEYEYVTDRVVLLTVEEKNNNLKKEKEKQIYG